MALRDFFKKEEDEFDPLRDLELSKLRVGYMLDYDDKTWQVSDYYKYDFGDGYISEEWELTSGRESLYLERTEDDEVEWALAKKVPIGALGNVRQHIIENEVPPDQIEYKGGTFCLDESGVGRMHKGSAPTQEFIYWEFIDEDDEFFLVVEQWGDTDFEAAAGQYVEEYQFTNILPSA
jgi:hypothetical protein